MESLYDIGMETRKEQVMEKKIETIIVESGRKILGSVHTRVWKSGKKTFIANVLKTYKRDDWTSLKAIAERIGSELGISLYSGQNFGGSTLLYWDA
jgi:hypothetical protein